MPLGVLTITLHSYQDQAVERFTERGSLLLAFEMGLGKTVTAIAVAEELLGRGDITSALIVVPSGLKLQWAASIARFTDVADTELVVAGEPIVVPEERYCTVIDGSPAVRQAAWARMEHQRPDYVIASYDTVVADLRILRRLGFDLVVLDEATAIKSFKAKRSKAIKKLTAPYRLALTGTPVDNRLEELFSIMEWVDPDVLGDFVAYDRAYIRRDTWGNVKGYRNMKTLHAKIAPALVRKRTTDADVAPYMPAVEERTRMIEMEPATAAVYQQISADLLAELEQLGPTAEWDPSAYYAGREENTLAGRVMAVHTAAQMLLVQPDLVRASAANYAKAEHLRTRPGAPKVLPGSKYCFDLVASGAVDGMSEGAKMAALRQEMRDLLTNSEAKAILVSRFTGMLNIVQKMFPDVELVTYHGEMTPGEKQAAVAKFQSDPSVRIFAMSHAGAYGVDLPAASHLILLDPPRSAGQYRQITARHVRASSRHSRVCVLRLITAASIEVREYERLALKGRVGEAAVDGRGADHQGRIDNDVTSLTSHLGEVLAAGAESPRQQAGALSH